MSYSLLGLVKLEDLSKATHSGVEMIGASGLESEPHLPQPLLLPAVKRMLISVSPLLPSSICFLSGFSEGI